jgi:LytS/YehU family sensor histidine kinase
VNTSNWNEGSNISLQSLKSGKYTIDIEADDLESHSIYRDQISFKIALPLWQEWWFLLLAIITIGLISYLIIRWRIRTYTIQQEEKNKLIRTNSELQIQSLQVQMNPHFIFNSLNSIQNFILSSKIEDAILYLGYLGTIIRMNLENVSKEFIHINDEILFLKKYIAIETMRFKEKLDIRLTSTVTDQSILIPPMLVQPIIENAIKHGVRHLNHTGIIHVDFAIENDLLHVTIEDNGVGRKQAALNVDKNHKSLGLALIKKRVKLLNEKNQSHDFSLSIEDLQDNGQPSGTKVSITLKIVKIT